MGYFGTYASGGPAADAWQEIRAEFGASNVLDEHQDGNEVWFLCPITEPPGSIIAVVKLQREGRGWAYKLISENDGPRTRSVPPKSMVLAASEPLTETARKWRATWLEGRNSP